MNTAGNGHDHAGIDAFKAAMRRLAAGVTIVTAQHDGQRRGLTATAVCSLSAHPPSLMVCINRTAEAHDLIVASGALCVNVLAGHHQALAETFAARDGSKGESRFRRGEWDTLTTGAPYLKDALAAFDCRVARHVTTETHSAFFADVVAARSLVSDDALIYFDGYFCGLGPHSLHRMAEEVGAWL